MKPFGVVYLIWNMINGRRYVGQTTRKVEERFKEHASCKNMLIGKAIRKYGAENFRYSVIKSCASKEELNAQEIYFIAALHCKAPYGYNCTDGGEGTIGLERTPEYRAKLSAAFSGEKNPRYGKKILLSTKQKSSPRTREQNARQRLAKTFRRLLRANPSRLNGARTFQRRIAAIVRTKT